jgi:hypothetical protein
MYTLSWPSAPVTEPGASRKGAPSSERARPTGTATWRGRRPCSSRQAAKRRSTVAVRSTVEMALISGLSPLRTIE